MGSEMCIRDSPHPHPNPRSISIPASSPLPPSVPFTHHISPLFSLHLSACFRCVSFVTCLVLPPVFLFSPLFSSSALCSYASLFPHPFPLFLPSRLPRCLILCLAVPPTRLLFVPQVSTVSSLLFVPVRHSFFLLLYNRFKSVQIFSRLDLISPWYLI